MHFNLNWFFYQRNQLTIRAFALLDSILWADNALHILKMR